MHRYSFITVKIAVPAAVANSALSAEAERLLRQQAGTAVERGKQKKRAKKRKRLGRRMGRLV